MVKSCRKCILTEKVEGVSINDSSFCDYCAGNKIDDWHERFDITEERKHKLRQELDLILEEVKGKSDYDCVLALSGGKDSAYLLNHLISEKKLRVLAVHVKTPFESPIAQSNETFAY